MINLLRDPLPKSLIWIGMPIIAIVLIILLFFIRFPYDEFRVPLQNQLSQISNAEVRIGTIEPAFTWAGPALAAVDVNFIQPNQPRMTLERIQLRPAWSSGWFNLAPTLDVGITSPLGSAQGMLSLGSAPRWTGTINLPDLSALPLPETIPVGLTGSLIAEADLQLRAGQAAGPVEFEALAGSFSHPEIPIPVEFKRLIGELALGGQNLLEVKELLLDGPVIAADIGGVIQNPTQGMAPAIDLDVIIEVKSPPLRAMLMGMGVQLDRAGRTSIELGGTLTRPITR
ncbi:MAG: type II secretion system protein GspN [Deltaproteobacteria bacterium]|nr:type II secretion system protein GspN [Deltaproteobacteria bacterium]